MALKEKNQMEGISVLSNHKTIKDSLCYDIFCLNFLMVTVEVCL